MNMIKQWWIYTQLEMKRCMKMMAKAVLSMLIILAGSIGCIAAISTFFLKSSVFEPVKVAVVIPEDESVTKMIVQYISGMDSVSAICKFKYMGEDEAKTALENQEVQAAVILPEHLYEDMYVGGSADVQVFILNDQKVNTRLFKELLNDGVSMLKTAEAGVFATTQTASICKVQMDSSEVANYIAYAYLENAMQRNQIFASTVVSPFGKMSVVGFYMSAAMTIMILFIGMTFGFLYQKKEHAVAAKLKINGLGYFWQTATKMLVMTIMVWIIQNIVYMLCSGVSYLVYTDRLFGVSDLIKSFLTYESMARFEPIVCLEMFLTSAAVSAWFHLCYSLAGDGKRGHGLLLGINSIMVVCSGIIIPTAYMPEIFAKINAWTPVTVLNNAVASMLFGSLSGMQILGLIVWSMVACVAGTLITFERRDG